MNSVTLGRVIEELIREKRAANRRPSYVRQLDCYLHQFARGRESEPLKSIDRIKLQEWFSRYKTPSTLRSRITFVSVLFGYSVRAGYIERNPCEQLERVSVDRNPPRILSPSETRRMMLFAKRKMRWRLPQLVLGVYAGIRPHELTRLYWRDVDLDRGYVRIDAAAAKTRRRRIVNLDPKAIAWLRHCERREHRPIGSNSDRWKKAIKRGCGIEWTPDLLRHTAASYLLAKHGDAGRVARMLGNSPEVLLRHYHQLVSEMDCRRFWRTL